MAKRTRRRFLGVKYSVSDPSTEAPEVPEVPEAQDNFQVRVVTVGAKDSRGRFGTRNSIVNVSSVPEIPSSAAEATVPHLDSTLPPDEDPNALDASEWYDMFNDNEIHVVKRKRKQRNDSVSYLFVLKTH